MQPIAAAFSQVDPSLLEASALLGSSRWRTFTRIILPLSVGVVVKAFAWQIVLKRDGVVSQLLVGLGIWDEPQRLLFTETGLVLGAANIFLSQSLVSDSSGFSYIPTVSYGKAGTWSPLVTSVSYLDSERLINGNYLVTAIIKVESEVETTVVIPATASGRDLLQAPRQVITRLVLNPGKTQILSQAIYVVEKGAK